MMVIWLKRHPAFFAVILMLLISFPWLWFRGMQNPDETRYGAITLEMLARKNFITPYLNGVPYFEKPPLIYWLGSLSVWLLGPIEGGLRLWAFFSGMLLSSLCASIAAKYYGNKVGINAAIVVTTTIFLFVFSQIFIIDLLVAALITGAMGSFLSLSMTTGIRKDIYCIWFCIFCAFAVLAKGLIGIVIPGLVGFAWCLITGRFNAIRTYYWLPGTLLLAAIVVPWHVWMEVDHPGFLNFYLIHEHLQRFSTTVHRRHQGIWFFPLTLIIGMMPWTGYVGSSLVRGFYGWHKRETSSEVDLFLILWVIVVFSFFFFSQSQLAGYILPLVPPLAILIGRLFSEPRGYFTEKCGLILPLVLILGVTLYFQFGFNGQWLGDEFLFSLGAAKWALLSASLGTVACLVYFLFNSGAGLFKIACIYIPLIAITNYSATLYQPKSIRHLLLSNAGEIATHPIIAYRTYILDATFYFNRPTIMVDVVGELEPGNKMLPRPDLFLSRPQLLKKLNSEERIFVILRKERLSELPLLKVIGQEHGIVLAVNR